VPVDVYNDPFPPVRDASATIIAHKYKIVNRVNTFTNLKICAIIFSGVSLSVAVTGAVFDIGRRWPL
jgi:hypothetical protein